MSFVPANINHLNFRPEVINPFNLPLQNLIIWLLIIIKFFCWCGLLSATWCPCGKWWLDEVVSL